MDAAIVSRAAIGAHLIVNKARSAHARGDGRDEHGFNWHSHHAINVWQAEWDRCDAESRAAEAGAQRGRARAAETQGA